MKTIDEARIDHLAGMIVAGRELPPPGTEFIFDATLGDEGQDWWTRLHGRVEGRDLKEASWLAREAEILWGL